MDTSNDVTITIAVESDRATVHLAGEIDAASVPALADSAEALVDQPLTCAAIDLDLITFIDCSGLDCLFEYRARLEASNISVTFVNPNPAVLKLLRLTGLDTTLIDHTALETTPNGTHPDPNKDDERPLKLEGPPVGAGVSSTRVLSPGL